MDSQVDARASFREAVADTRGYEPDSLARRPAFISTVERFRKKPRRDLRSLPRSLPKSGRERGVPMSRRLRDFYRSEFGIRGKGRALVSGSGIAHDQYARTVFPKLCKAAGLPRMTPKVLRTPLPPICSQRAFQ